MIALAYGLGLGILSHWMLLLGIVEIPLALHTIVPPLIVMFILLYFIYNKTKNTANQKNNTSLFPQTTDFPLTHSLWDKTLIYIFIAYIAIILIFVFWCSLKLPIQSWDAIATSAFKAKIFFYDQSIHQLNLPHASYPLHVPLIESWIAFNLNRWDDFLVKIIFPFAFTAYLIVHYSFLRSLTNHKWALGGVCLLISSNFMVFHSTIAYREIFMMYYCCTAIILLILWNKERSDALLYLASLYAGFVTFIKLEGTGYLIICTLLLVLILWRDTQKTLKSKLNKFLKFVIPSYSLCLLFHVYKISLNISSMAGRTNLVFTWEHLLRSRAILYDLFMNLFMSGNWSLIWFLLAVSFLCYSRKIRQSDEIKLLVFALFMFLSVYLIIFSFTAASIDNPTTLARVILHFFPLSTLLIILLNYPDASRERKNTSSLNPK